MARERRARRMRRHNEDEVEEQEQQEVETKEAEVEDKKPEVEKSEDADEQTRRTRRARVAEDGNQGGPKEPKYGAGPVLDLLEGLRQGDAIIIRREDANTWMVTSTDFVGAVAKKTRLPQNFNDTLLTDDYKDWQDEWSEMTYEEKVKWAKAEKVKWDYDPNMDERINHMRVSLAVQNHLGIEKYKPEYQSHAQRKAAKDKARMGLPY